AARVPGRLVGVVRCTIGLVARVAPLDVRGREVDHPPARRRLDVEIVGFVPVIVIVAGAAPDADGDIAAAAHVAAMVVAFAVVIVPTAMVVPVRTMVAVGTPVA